MLSIGPNKRLKNTKAAVLIKAAAFLYVRWALTMVGIIPEQFVSLVPVVLLSVSSRKLSLEDPE